MALIFVAAALLWAVAHVIPARLERPDSRAPDSRGNRPAVKRLFARRRRPRDGALIELATELATRLRSGAAPADAWASAATRAGLPADVGGDGIPVALHADGAADVRAAWVMAAELGAPLADILDECALAFTHAEENEAARAIALAGPTASARLLASLPVVGILLGSALGADPLGVLVSGGLGSLAGGVGIVLYAVGLRWSARLLRAAARTGDEGEVDATVTLALLRAGLRGGISVPRALQAAGAAVGSEHMARAGRLLLLGASWEEAWRGVRERGVEGLVTRIVEPAWTDGANPIPLLERAAAAWNARRDRRAREAAARLGVRLIVPLGTCYLPAFVLVGVLPVLLATGGQIFPG